MMFGRNPGAAAVAERIQPGTTGVEIGVWQGETARLFLARDLEHLHLVDPWSVAAYQDSSEFGGFRKYLERYAPLTGGESVEAFESYYDKLYALVVSRFAGDPVSFHRMESRAFWMRRLGQGKQFDWVYIDGSHEYGEVLNDLICASQVCRGPIYGDDYGNKPNVKRAVDDFCYASGATLEVFAKNQYEINTHAPK